MKKHIAEELPARKHAPAAAAPAAKAKGGAAPKGGEKKEGGEGESSEKRIRQAVYDIRYRARREEIDLKAAFSQYMSNSSLSQAERTAVREKLFGKAGGVSEQYIGVSEDWAVDGVAGAMFKVFVEGVKEEPQLELVYERQMEGKEGVKYQVRVLDPKSGRSYVRMATREKITQLRARGLKVEMTDAGEPYEGKKKEVPNKGGLDKPVAKSQRDGDVNDDGKKDKTDSYIYNRRDKINKAMETRKEDFLWSEGATGTTSTEGQNKSKITGAGVDNSSRIRVFPQDGSDVQAGSGIIQAGTELEGSFLAEKSTSRAQQRFMGMVYAAKKGEEPASPEVAKAAKGMSKKEAKKYAKTKHKGLPEKVSEEATCPKCGKSPCECDTRANKTYRDLLKNKLRSMGKNVLAACGDEENLEKSYDDMMTASFIKTNRETGKLEPVHVFKESDNLPVTAYNKGDRFTGRAGAMSDAEVRRANEGSAERIRKSIFKKA
jgi:hypothetical protein